MLGHPRPDDERDRTDAPRHRCLREPARRAVQPAAGTAPRRRPDRQRARLAGDGQSRTRARGRRLARPRRRAAHGRLVRPAAAARGPRARDLRPRLAGRDRLLPVAGRDRRGPGRPHPRGRRLGSPPTCSSRSTSWPAPLRSPTSRRPWRAGPASAAADPTGWPLGVVDADSAAAVPTEARERTAIASVTIAQSAAWVVALPSDAVLTDLIRVMSENDLSLAVVIDESTRDVRGLASAERINAVVGAELAAAVDADTIAAEPGEPSVGRPTSARRQCAVLDGVRGHSSGWSGPLPPAVCRVGVSRPRPHPPPPRRLSTGRPAGAARCAGGPPPWSHRPARGPEGVTMATSRTETSTRRRRQHRGAQRGGAARPGGCRGRGPRAAERRPHRHVPRRRPAGAAESADDPDEVDRRESAARHRRHDRRRLLDAATRRTALRLRPGDLVDVEGALRRRFFGGPGGRQSRYEVEASALRRVSGGGATGT